ncbi:Prephenate dehydratase-associated ABC transporter, substrate-binding protein [hydrothermal vent metagenome]|uniref:Prephenate dehydratase-associated ABC transporter, substrate-binding protein n=1 Tax=hydrothermal vent metagenome TaxID=652676 RepID=A0A3B0TWF5_9ZZZZ
MTRPNLRKLGSTLKTMAIGMVLATTLLAANAAAQDSRTWRHGISLFGEVKYGPDFANFDYVDPNAPKGGQFRLSAIGTFDTLNPFNLKGTAVAGAGLIYDTLMTGSLDEPSSVYGLIAESLSYPDDYSSVTYKLRPQARWHDGKPITVDDVIYSLESLRKSHPFYNAYYKNIVRAEKTGEREVTFTFDQKGNRELPQVTGELVIIPKHFWEGVGKDGKKRDFLGSTLEPSLGSGAYRFGTIKPGRSITYERVKDYWAADLPVNRGTKNFDTVRYEYFRDLDVRLEGFKGDAFDFIAENSAKRWATGYEFPAKLRGDVIKETFRTKQAEAMQGFVFNTRKPKYQDRRVRRAFDYAFDFEWMNENVFFNQYQRITSYFENTELASRGLPEGRELEILNEVRDSVPPELFTTPYETPVNGDRRKVRANLKKARALLREAGWVIKDGKLVNAETGKKMFVEFMVVQPDMERVINPFRQNLKRLGIESTVRVIDVSQYRARLDDFDFDVVISSFRQSLSPGNEQRGMWGSQAADRKGSRNLIGIKNPAVDKLIDKIIFATDRAELVAAARALDRVLLWNFYLVPQFFTPDIRTARWDRYSRPEVTPDYGFTYYTWWWDEAKAAKVKAGK